jgi:hypothetical protein
MGGKFNMADCSLIKQLLETHDTTSTAKFNLMKKTALKIRHIFEAMDEEEISFHEQTTQNLEIETGLEGIESAKRNYNDTKLRQNAQREIQLKKPAVMVYTDGSIMGEERSVGVYCEAKGFEGRYKIEKNVPISSAELKAIEIATSYSNNTNKGLSYSMTRKRHAMEGDRQ